MIEVLRGDRKNIEFEITDSANDDAPLDLTGKVVYFMVKESFDDADADAKISKNSDTAGHFTISTPASGEGVLHLTGTDTAIDPRTYVYDLRIKAAGSDPYSVEADKFIVKRTVRKTFT